MAREDDWHVTPSLDLSVIPAAGDAEGKSTVRFTGTRTCADLDVNVMDYMSYRGAAGVEIGTGSVKVGLNYSLTGSEHTATHAGQLTFRLEF